MRRAATFRTLADARDALPAQRTRSVESVEGALPEALIRVTVGHVREHIADLASAAG